MIHTLHTIQILRMYILVRFDVIWHFASGRGDLHPKHSWAHVYDHPFPS